jgi:hypothetical protein
MDAAVKAPKVPLAERINFRVITFVAVLVGIFLFLFGGAIKQMMTGGIVDRGDYVEVDLFTISNFEMDQALAGDDSVPQEFRELNGKRVQLIGEMYRSTESRTTGDVHSFDLVYSISKCCVTSAPKIQHFIQSRVVPGKKVKYYPGLVKVVGTLHVGVQKQDGRIVSVYRLDVESTEPA